MGFFKKIFRRKKDEKDHSKNIGELPSSPANKKKAAKKISRTEKKIAKRAAKAEKEARKNGGSLYGSGSPGSPQKNGKSTGGGGRPDRYEYDGQYDGGSVQSPSSINPVVDEVVRRPSFNTSIRQDSMSYGQQHQQHLQQQYQQQMRQQMQMQQQQMQQQQQNYYQQQVVTNSSNVSGRSRGSGPVDLDEDNYASSTDEESPDNFNALEGMGVNTSRNGVNNKKPSGLTLNHQHLQQFEQQQHQYSNGAKSSNNPYGMQQQPYQQVTRLPNGQLVSTYESPDRRTKDNIPPASPTYSSDFCLSTDNEDESYNQMRQGAKGMFPVAPTGANLEPALDSPDNDSMMYTDDEGGTLFANLKGQLSEEEAMTPRNATNQHMPLPPSASAAGNPRSPAAAAPRVSQGPRDPDGDLSHMDPPSMDDGDTGPGKIQTTWTSPEKSSRNATPNSAQGESSAGSVENHNPNPNGRTAARYTFADENNAEKYPKAANGGEARPASPSPGYKVNGAANTRGAVMYPDSTDSEFEQMPMPGENLLPPMQNGGNVGGPTVQQQQQQVAHSQHPNQMQQQPFRQMQGNQQQQQQQQTSDSFGDSFANFANFDSTFNPFQSNDTNAMAPQQQQQQPDPFQSNGPKFIVEGGPAGNGPLGDLMAIQKEREEKSNRRSKKDPSKSSSSINSAPVVAGSSAQGKRTSTKQNSDAGVRSTASAGSSSAAMAAKDKLRQRRREKEKARSRAAAQDGSDDDGSDADRNEAWLFDGVTGTLGPRGIAADLESLGGRSNRSKNSTGNKSHRSHRSHRSSKSRRRKKRSDESVNSRDSRYSHKSYRSTRSAMSHMSEQSRSVANDLLRLEMQLAMVGAQKGGTGDGDKSVGSRRSRTSRGGESRKSSVSKRSKVTVVAPPGKLGIILANKTDSKGTVVSGVRTSSVLVDKVSPGDRIIAIDGEDVSRMTVSEITTIMARKSEFERVLTVLTSPKTKKQTDDLPTQIGGAEMASVTGSSITSYSNQYRS